MQFLFVANTPRDPLAGASGCDISVMNELRNLGHTVDEVWADDMPRRLRHPNLHQWLELPRNFAAVVADRCRDRRYDVIQVNQPHAWLAAKQHRVERRPGVFINRSHGWEPALREAIARYGSSSTDTRPFIRKALSRVLAIPLERHNELVLHWSDGVVLCSVDDFDYITNRYRTPAKKLLPLAPGIDPWFLDPLPEESNPERWRRMIYVGNFCPPKAPEIVASVFRGVANTVENFRGTWVCPAQFHGAVRQLLGDASRSVECRDWMSKEDLRSLFDQNGLFLFPSYFEGFALTFLQAMARGLCVLGTRVDGMRQTLQDGVNGFLFDRGDANGIVREAVRLLKNSEQTTQISRQARITAERFTWRQAANTYSEFCTTLMTRKDSGNSANAEI